MRKTLLVLSGLILPLAASAAVNVEWIAPETFRDAYATSVKSEKSRQMALDDFQKFIVAQATPLIDKSDTLTIKVTQLDMTGEYEPWDVKFQNVRKMKSPYFGYIAFSYSLVGQDGKVIKEGKEALTNEMLLPIDLRDRDEMDPYLRATLRDWINRTFRDAKS